ncbi:MAG: hypothetical protein PHP52_05115 [Bacteroidales bacterium]|nr:hypothetical protein [Bacteroidales bacterium]MDD4216350.1 hypothetical protein [Bacteroidales bacterium]MDY0140492.1 hypothetical protein [Bacteroidales bacterium]
MTSETAKKKIDWTKPADQNPEITVDDFKDMVKKSEKSTKSPISELDKKIKEWQQERNLT